MKTTERTLDMYRSSGYIVAIVERWIPGAFIRRDYLGIIDILATKEKEIIGVQSCGTSFSEHEKKILGEGADMARHWLSCPARRLVLVGWRKLKVKRGGKAFRYESRVREFKLEEFLCSDRPAPVSAGP